jgi:predicted alpha/beta hydrolase
MPDGNKKPQVIVMGNGFGAQRWMRPSAYAEEFAQRCLAVFVYGYRGFNDSDGKRSYFKFYA